MPSLFFSLKKPLPEDMVKNLKNNTILDTNSLSSRYKQFVIYGLSSSTDGLSPFVQGKEHTL